MQMSNAFPNAFEAEVPVAHAGRQIWIEAAAVVGNGKPNEVAFGASGDADCVGVSVTDGVDREFANDLQKGVCGVV